MIKRGQFAQTALNNTKTKLDLTNKIKNAHALLLYRCKCTSNNLYCQIISQ